MEVLTHRFKEPHEESHTVVIAGAPELVKLPIDNKVVIKLC